ncbi:phage baseplate assembly protein domain-containing protein [Acinetobacter haemolyticus]|uniref:phage baseplate assembly protein domain-containing protein n=1 Tax=Acinetobacter haemolyticus TaxID=29430 RepID=UPI0021CD3E3D|nr:phage baseplate assembly protein [Acinetobacter haemolyticus]MCU4378283.1 phage baseplate assembly protein [Acinetobacter haemolyticus]WPO67555.1 phage baseplate assembly protein [Acinetobacter haemolyticus]
MIKSIGSRIHKAGSQIRQVFLGIVARGSSKVLQLKGLAGETLQEVELIQQVGFSSYIPESAKVVVIPLQGKTAKSVVIATTGGAVVVNVAKGETCVYDQFGHQVLLHENGIKMLGDVEIIGELKVSEDIKSEKEISDKTSSMQAMRDVYNGHTHGSSPQPSVPME